MFSARKHRGSSLPSPALTCTCSSPHGAASAFWTHLKSRLFWEALLGCSRQSQVFVLFVSLCLSLCSWIPIILWPAPPPWTVKWEGRGFLTLSSQRLAEMLTNGDCLVNLFFKTLVGKTETIRAIVFSFCAYISRSDIGKLGKVNHLQTAFFFLFFFCCLWGTHYKA